LADQNTTIFFTLTAYEMTFVIPEFHMSDLTEVRNDPSLWWLFSSYYNYTDLMILRN